MNVNQGKCFPKTPRVVLEHDRSAFNTYIASKRSPYTRKNVSQNLHYCFHFISQHYPEIRSILEVTPDQFKAYLTHLNRRQIRKKVKAKYRSNLKAFIYFLVGENLAYNEKLPYNYTYIFSDRFVKLVDSADSIERDALTISDIFEILAFFEARNFRDFIMVSLLAYTGMRVGGLCALKIKDIDLPHRTLETQEKPTINSTGWNRYFFPRKFKVHLESYLLEVQSLHPQPKRLFPITTKTVRRQLRAWNQKHVNPHLFRDAINTHWVEMGLLDEGIRAILLNQTPTGINAGHYLKKYTQNDKSGKKRLKLYDQYFPY